MRITVFGASGQIGRQVVNQAVSVDHQVTAVVRSPEACQAIRDIDGVDVVVDDVMDPHDIAPHIQDADAVVSAIGARGNPRRPTSVSVDAMTSILQAMNMTGASRLVAMSAADFGNAQDDGMFMRRIARPLVLAFLKGSLRDLRIMEDQIVDSDHEWTIIRPPQLINQGRSFYRTAIGRNLPRALFARRADVADYIVNSLRDHGTYQQFVSIAR